MHLHGLKQPVECSNSVSCQIHDTTSTEMGVYHNRLPGDGASNAMHGTGNISGGLLPR